MNKELKETIDKVLDEERAHVYCQTCGQVFLDITMREYVSLTSHGNMSPNGKSDPDKWFIETGIHWCEYPEHQIIAELPTSSSINEVWENRKRRGKLTRKRMLPYFLKYRETAKFKFI